MTRRLPLSVIYTHYGPVMKVCERATFVQQKVSPPPPPPTSGCWRRFQLEFNSWSISLFSSKEQNAGNFSIICMKLHHFKFHVCRGNSTIFVVNWNHIKFSKSKTNIRNIKLRRRPNSLHVSISPWHHVFYKIHLILHIFTSSISQKYFTWIHTFFNLHTCTKFQVSTATTKKCWASIVSNLSIANNDKVVSIFNPTLPL